ncbi:MAG: ribonuclease P protein component [Patescibacteria group bacterium]|jgi:ribonuclease P protein component|nr:ribonuclease P protein component [Patescibacteria group bacterium]
MSKNSLRRKKDFGQVFAAGQSFYCQLFLIKVLENNLNNNRLGIIISKKSCKKAVGRNRIKRQLREVFRDKFEKTIKKNYDVVIIVSRNIVDKDFKTIEEKFEKLIQKIK